jgi:3-phosphoshikimate 1-carboxyvinyltransferase
MKMLVRPGNALRGVAQTPGDKSLSHRALLFAALAEGESQVDNFLVSGVTRVMLEALSALGVTWRLDGDRLTVQGRGPAGLRPPGRPLDCGNSATTLRLLAGALAAAGIPATLDGSEGLHRRPMDRIVAPLRKMGVSIEVGPGGTAPLRLAARPPGQPLKPLDETLPVASAQVKSCLLLAALAADGKTTLREPGPSRDHTERMLCSMGAIVGSRGSEVNGQVVYETHLIPPTAPLRPLRMCLPGDISAAAFLVVAGSVTPGSEIRIPGVGLNPTRTGLLEALRSMGGDVRVENEHEQGGEPAGELVVRSARLRGTVVSGDLVVRMIDEFSVFGTAAAFAQGPTVVLDASELRLKETDRIQTLCVELRRLGVPAEEREDGFTIPGGVLPAGGAVQAHGDHRLAMAMAVAGLAAGGPVTVDGAEMIDESFPGFAGALRDLGADVSIEVEGPA